MASANNANSIIYNFIKGNAPAETDPLIALKTFISQPSFSSIDISSDEVVSATDLVSDLDYTKVYNMRLRSLVYDRPRVFKELPSTPIYATYPTTAEEKSFDTYNSSKYSRLIGYKTLVSIDSSYGNVHIVETLPVWNMFSSRISFSTGVQLPVI